MIPHIAHFYWGAHKMPYLRYLTLYSFRKFNPSWIIKLHVPATVNKKLSWGTHEHRYEVSGHDFFPEINTLDIVVVKDKILDSFENLSEVHKSDLLRWHILASEGGLWADMDIIFFKSFKLPIDEDMVSTGMCICYYGHSIGFLISSGNNATFREIAEKTMKEYPEHYQSFGANFLNRHYQLKDIENTNRLNNVGGFYNIPMDVVYPYDAMAIKQIYEKRINAWSDNTIGLHWYAGHQLGGEYINKITIDNIASFDIVLTDAIRMAYE